MKSTSPVILSSVIIACSVVLQSCSSNENLAASEQEGQAVTKSTLFENDAIKSVRLGYTNRGLCPSEYVLSNLTNDRYVTATIRYTFPLGPTRRNPEFEQVGVAPGEQKRLTKYVRTGPFCPANASVGASIVGAYYGR